MKAKIEDLAWMTGHWAGEFGTQTVEESWSDAKLGNMSTMVRLSGPDGVALIELISICEIKDSLCLHLRQFSPTLEPVLSQDMPLQTIGDRSVSFATNDDTRIQTLSYRRTSDDNFVVDVTLNGGMVLTANLIADTQAL